MKQFVKGMMLILMCAIVVSLVKVSDAQAKSVNGVSPRFTSISECNVTLTLNGEAEVAISGKVLGVYGTANTSLSAVLQRQRGSSWVNVKTWEKSSASKSVRLQEVYPISSGTYRVMLIGTADGESTTVYSAVVTY